MGLSITVGILNDLRLHDEEGFESYRKLFAQLDKWLIKQNLSPHNEPEKIAMGGSYSCGFFYSMIHTLRRVAAHVAMSGKIPKPMDPTAAAKDPVVQSFYDEYSVGGSSFDHLMFHSDAEGFYLPQEFKEVLFPPDELRIPGGMIGSSPALRKECLILAEKLGLPTDLNPESQEMQAYLIEGKIGSAGWQRYPTESYVCLHLLGACETSIESRAAIVFG
jgi:hypothetical protein